MYIQNQLPAKERKDLLVSLLVEAIWVQVRLPYSRPILIGCCYSPPNANMTYLEGMCDLIDKISDEKKELFMLGDLNIDYFSISSHLRKRLLSVANACNLTQVVNLPTRVFTNRAGVKSSTCIDHIFTNVPEHCSNVISLVVGFSDHNSEAERGKSVLRPLATILCYYVWC